jgi:hypothetical protein
MGPLAHRRGIVAPRVSKGTGKECRYFKSIIAVRVFNGVGALDFQHVTFSNLPSI